LHRGLRASIWVLGAMFRLREHHWWPLIPAGILATIGVVSLIDQGGQLRDLSRLAWPIALVAIGALIVIRATTRRRARD
jgi:drug/metabolite transporter (DMT)-like permease